MDESIRLYDEEVPLTLELIGQDQQQAEQELNGYQQNNSKSSPQQHNKNINQQPPQISIRKIEVNNHQNNTSHNDSTSDVASTATPTVNNNASSSSSSSSTRLIVSLPQRMIDTDLASHLVDRLLDEVAEHQSSCGRTQYFLEKLVMRSVRFTDGGMSAITNYLAMQNAPESVRHLEFHDIVGTIGVGGDDTSGSRNQHEEDEEDYNLAALCRVFQTKATLHTVDLSHNRLVPYVWDALGELSDLKRLILEDVEMNDASFQQLQNGFMSGDTLQALHICTLSANIGRVACDAMNSVLGACRDLRSFCWDNKGHKPIHLPLAGLTQVSKNMFKNSFGYMKHLELTGGILPLADDNNPNVGICAALERFHKLQMLKLSRAGLTSDKVKRIVTALRSARPPLTAIDFSYNQIDCEGASWVAQLSCLRAITKNLRHMNLQHNRIAKEGALEIVEAFASKSCGSSLQMRLEGNRIDSSSIFLTLAKSKHEAETELTELRKDCDRLRADKKDAQSNMRELLTAQSAMIKDMQQLKARAEQLEDDRASLVKAFSVLGMMHHVEERDNILNRLTKLEESIHGKQRPRIGSIGNKMDLGSNHSKKSRSKIRSRSPQPTYFARVISAPRSGASTPRGGTPRRRPSYEPPISPARSVQSNSAANIQQQIQQQASQPTNKAPARLNRSGRPAKARDLMVRAASERWKSLVQSDESPERNRLSRLKIGRANKMGRSKSNKSLAEFLNKSAPSVCSEDEISFEGQSIQTTPTVLLDSSMPAMGTSLSALGSSWRPMADTSAPAQLAVTPATLRGTRRRIRQNMSSARSLPPRNESKSLVLQSPSAGMDSSGFHDSSGTSRLHDSSESFESVPENHQSHIRRR